MVVFKKSLDVQVSTTFLDPEGRLVVLDVTHMSKQSFRLVAVYTPKECTQTEFYWDLETYLVT